MALGRYLSHHLPPGQLELRVPGIESETFGVQSTTEMHPFPFSGCYPAPPMLKAEVEGIDCARSEHPTLACPMSKGQSPGLTAQPYMGHKRPSLVRHSPKERAFSLDALCVCRCKLQHETVCISMCALRVT